MAPDFHDYVRGRLPPHVVTLRVAVPESRCPTRDDTTRFYSELLDTLRSQPGIVSASVTSNLPLAGNAGSTLSVQGRDDVALALAGVAASLIPAERATRINPVEALRE